jgi:hypothetical protein
MLIQIFLEKIGAIVGDRVAELDFKVWEEVLE